MPLILDLPLSSFFCSGKLPSPGVLSAFSAVSAKPGYLAGPSLTLLWAPFCSLALSLPFCGHILYIPLCSATPSYLRSVSSWAAHSLGCPFCPFGGPTLRWLRRVPRAPLHVSPLLQEMALPPLLVTEASGGGGLRCQAWGSGHYPKGHGDWSFG